MTTHEKAIFESKVSEFEEIEHNKRDVIVTAFSLIMSAKEDHTNKTIIVSPNDFFDLKKSLEILAKGLNMNDFFTPSKPVTEIPF